MAIVVRETAKVMVASVLRVVVVAAGPAIAAAGPMAEDAGVAISAVPVPVPVPTVGSVGPRPAPGMGTAFRPLTPAAGCSGMVRRLIFRWE